MRKTDAMAVKEESVEQQKSAVSMTLEDTTYQDRMFHSLNMLRKNRQFCDVALQIECSGDMREIHAHKNVLASASPYFFDLFTAENKSNRNVFKLTNHNIDAFEGLVEFAYTGRLVIPLNLVKATYVSANKLRMSSVAKQCGKHLLETMTADKCIGLRSLSGIASNTELLGKVDNFIRQNILDVTKSKAFLGLQTIQVELLHNNYEEKNATNVKHMCDMVLDWLKSTVDEQNVKLEELTQKVHMLYLNLDRTLHDCSDIENGDFQDSEVIQDYKKLSKKTSANTATKNRTKAPSQVPAKPRQFLYTKSDSNSSLSSLSDEEDGDWRAIAATVTGENSMVGLVSVYGALVVLSVVQRVHHSPLSSRNPSMEKISAYTMVPPMNSGRCAVGTAGLEGKLVVCGGYDRGECLKTVESYDFSTNKWTEMQPMKGPRGRFNAAVVNNKLYAIGGCNGQKELSSAEYLDPDSQSWKQLPNLPVVRSHAGVCSVEKKIYVVGGWNGQRGLKRCDIFDTETNTWHNMASLTTGRYQAGVAALNGFVYAVGGCDSLNFLNSVERYDPKTDQWMVICSLSTARRGCGVSAYNGKLYVVGGHDGVHSLCTVEIYDPDTNTWSNGPSLTTCRANVGVSMVDGRLFAVGGFNGKTFLNTIEYIDDANEWTTSVARGNELGNGAENGYQYHGNGNHAAPSLGNGNREAPSLGNMGEDKIIVEC